MDDNLVTCVLENQLAMMYQLRAESRTTADRQALQERIGVTMDTLGKWRSGVSKDREIEHG